MSTCGDDPGRDLLKELIYQQVRGQVNLCQLIILEDDLEQIIKSVDAASDADASSPEQQAREFIDEAWRRIESEWAGMRAR